MIKKYKIEYGIQKYEEEEIIKAKSLMEAVNEAYDQAIAMLESYDGLHGYPYYGTCQECEGSGLSWDHENECLECDGAGEFSWEDFLAEAESWIVYKATEIDE